jgi:hypothetical protein
MNNEFVTVYSAAIITSGEYVYVKKNGHQFMYLEGAEVNPFDGVSPKTCLIEKLAAVVGLQFSGEWIKYIGTSNNEKECTPTEDLTVKKKFVVIHYWLNANSLNEFEYVVRDMCKVKLVDMVENEDNDFLYTDCLAAKRVLEIKDKGFNELKRLT